MNMKSDWANGPYTVLDHADEGTARFLLARGATLTPNVAARLGWFDELQALINADASLVHARGGDGQQPLHEAKTVAIADFLLDRGADINVRCIDHKSMPAQYTLVDRPDVCRRLLERGATPDIFMAARLGDVALARRLLDADPSCVGARIHEHGYAPVPPLHIYCWTLGFGLSPRDVATRFGHREVHDLLASRSPERIQFLDALSSADEQAAKAVLVSGTVAPPRSRRARITAVWRSRSSSSASTPPTSCSVWLRSSRNRYRRRHGTPCRVLGGQRTDGRRSARAQRATRRQGFDAQKHTARMGRVRTLPRVRERPGAAQITRRGRTRLRGEGKGDAAPVGSEVSMVQGANTGSAMGPGSSTLSDASTVARGILRCRRHSVSDRRPNPSAILAGADAADRI